jgi:signal transduction histidine kinase
MTLDTIPLFRHLSPSELSALRQIAQERKFPAGSEIIQAGDPGDGVYFVKNGSVEISAGQGNTRVFTRLGPTEIFGEMAIIENRPRSATARAVGETEVYFLPRNEILDFLEKSPGLKQALLQQISQRLREFNQVHVRELVQSEHLAMIGRLVQGIVHDLRGPLSIINLSVEVLGLEETVGETRAKTQSRIRKQVERISDLVGDILIFTQESHKAPQPQPVDYAAFVAELVADLNEEVALKDWRLELPQPPPSVMVLMDARRLGRVFYNLVNNATDMMRSGGKIFLRFELHENEVITEIEDTGPGIAPQIADTLFQPFATHGKTRGTGLGLPICKKILEDHGGKIWVKSSTGRGAIFCFSLPLAK